MLWQLKKNASRGANSSISEPALERRLDVGDRVRERERDLLHRRAALLADVVAGDRDRVPLRDLLRAVLEDVGGQPHRRLGRVDVVAAGDVLLEHVVLDRAAELLGRHALLLADELVEQQQDRRRRVDRHRRRDLVERDLVEADPHVLDRVDRDPGAADLAVAERVVGVAPELGRQVEGHREAGRAVLDQVAVALVGVLRAGEAGVLAHRPEPVAVHALVDPAGERVVAGLAEPLFEPGGDVVLVVEAVDLDPRVGEHALVVGADDRRDVAVQILLDRPLGGRVEPALVGRAAVGLRLGRDGLLALGHRRESRRPRWRVSAHRCCKERGGRSGSSSRRGRSPRSRPGRHRRPPSPSTAAADPNGLRLESIRFEAAPGEANSLTAARTGEDTFTFTDAGATLTPGCGLRRRRRGRGRGGLHHLRPGRRLRGLRRGADRPRRRRRRARLHGAAVAGHPARRRAHARRADRWRSRQRRDRGGRHLRPDRSGSRRRHRRRRAQRRRPAHRARRRRRPARGWLGTELRRPGLGRRGRLRDADGAHRGGRRRPGQRRLAGRARPSHRVRGDRRRRGR